MSLAQVRGAIDRAHEHYRERPEAAFKPNTPAAARWTPGGLRCELAAPGGATLVTDMPEALGGGGAGIAPGWLLRASMASCAATTLAMRAARAGIELRSLEVEVHSASDARPLVGFDEVSAALSAMRMSIRIVADGVPESTLRELAAFASLRSPVSCTLGEAPPLEVEVTIG